MRRSSLLLAVLLVVASCGTADIGASTTTTNAAAAETTVTTSPVTTTTSSPTTTAASSFPVTIETDGGPVNIDEMPESIVSLSTVATEILFALGAGDQVVAVDDQSNYPEEAPMSDLSGFTPNVEAILSYEPDLVFISYDPGDLVASLEAADVTVVNFGAAQVIEDTYRQIETTGVATGHAEEARELNESIAADLARIAADAPVVKEGTTYFHEIDSNLYTVTSSTYFGQIYALFGLENIADAADEDGSAFGYPQLSSEFVVAADPDLIFLADALYGESPETVAARPGWSSLTAVQEGSVFELDADVASRWGPRIVEFAEAVARALEGYAGGG
ncbi:MAG TPA: ABC transporter substrate-binding protein [Acidimicrobiia bacterium]|nr:ABC transporter substrate-binding protein [Acidimicrobiia bacterium]